MGNGIAVAAAAPQPAENSIQATQSEAPARWNTALSRQEVAELLEQKDWRSWVSILSDWGLIAASMALVAVWPNPLSILLALVLIGTRQLGLAVMMHEAAHRTLFRGRRLNDWAGQWLAAYPVWSDMAPYRAYHLQHHARTGSDQDPDIGLIKPFPITRASLRRKVGRDLSGRTGIKFARAALRRTFLRWNDPDARRAGIGFAVTNAVMLGGLALLGRPELYLLWVGAWLTTNTLVTRIRSIAEHALTPDQDDALGNTRTTIARWWERLFLAPNRVNYHLEHHLLMTVPHYNLPRMHKLLRERGVLDRACLEEHGYRAIMERAASKAA